MFDWDATDKPFGAAYFYSENPIDDAGAGDDAEPFDTLEEARKRAVLYIQNKKFKLVVIWRDLGDEWEEVDRFKASDY